MRYDIVNWRNAHRFSDLWVQSHELRHRAFIDRSGWDVPHHDGMEFDQYDTPRASYVIAHDAGRCAGVCRLVQTIHPYMIEQVFPHLLPYAPPKRRDVWEATRFAVSADQPAALREAALKALIVGVQRFGLDHGVDHFLGLMPVAIFKRSLIRHGVRVNILTDAAQPVDGILTATAEIAVDPATVEGLMNFVT